MIPKTEIYFASRKTASAHVYITKGVGKIRINNVPVEMINPETAREVILAPLEVIGEYEDFLKIHSIIHPQHGPFHPRRPDTIIKRMIRGMLPKEKPSKKTDLARLRTYIGVPKEVKGFEKIQFEKSKITRVSSKYTTMAELSRYIGGTNF